MTNRAGTFVSNLSGEMAYESFRPAPLPPNPPVGKIPKECIDFTVIDEVLIPKRSFVYSEKDGVLYHYPLTNVYEDGRICWGNLKFLHAYLYLTWKEQLTF